MTAVTEPSIPALVEPLLPLFAEAAGRADRDRRLPVDVVAAARQAGLFRLLVPRAFGGHEAELPGYIALLEAVAGACGSVAWCLAVSGGSAHALAVQFSPDEAAPWLAALGAGAILSGTLPPLGTAVPVEGGYTLSGRWPFASLSEHADVRMVGAVAPGPLPDVTSSASYDPRIEGGTGSEPPDRHLRYCIVPADSAGVTLHDTWHALTMQGSGSCDVEIGGIFVPEARTTAVDWSRYRPDLGGALRVPFSVTQGLSLAAIAAGIARAALDLFIARVRSRRGALPPASASAPLQLALAEAAVDVAASRALLRTGAEAAWQRALVDAPIESEERAPWWIAAHGAAQAAVRAVDRLFAYSGAHALYDDAPLQRHFRDVRVAQHHIHLHPGETALEIGRSLLGLPAERHNW